MTLLVVGGGVAGLLLVGGFFMYMFWGYRETTINNGVGHLQIFNADYFQKDETRTLEYGLENVRAAHAEEFDPRRHASRAVMRTSPPSRSGAIACLTLFSTRVCTASGGTRALSSSRGMSMEYRSRPPNRAFSISR